MRATSSLRFLMSTRRAASNGERVTNPHRLEEVRNLLQSSLLGPFYGSKFQQTLDGTDISSKASSVPVEDPATGEILCHVFSTTPAQIDEAVNGADIAFRSGIWSKASPAHRATVLTNISRALAANMEEFIQIESLQTGRCIREMRAQLTRVPEWLDYHAALARTHQGLVLPTQGKLLNYVKRYPLGVVAQITPFNHPLLIAMKKIAPALAAGNSVVVKPSELAPITVLKFAELALEHGLPPGVLNVLPGTGPEVASTLVNHVAVKKVDITAGTSAGQVVGQSAGKHIKLFTAELGGKAPILVFSDADMASAVSGTCFSAFVASGQTCVSGTRVLVHARIAAQFLERLVQRLESITKRIGSRTHIPHTAVYPADARPSTAQNPASMMGPVISARSLARLESVIGALTPEEVYWGGKRLTGPSPLDGTDLSKGHFFSPTILTISNTDSRAWRQELFGPVITAVQFDTEEEAIHLANASEYALGGGIFTSSLDTAHRVAEAVDAGIVWVNTWHRNDPSSPWGGWKPSSGVGRENGVEAFESCEWTVPTIPLIPTSQAVCRILHVTGGIRGWVLTRAPDTQSKSVIVNIAPLPERQADDWFAESAGGSGPRYG
ncbi:Aldedh-domain-containing protein [Calocera cornea HHB12733]|uniref:Aldedh-domain-containing protein n=1 Tax=Calocera cornea HHB12733 TaxID=1353952 RepID=A0A165JVT2_9BASI|nr:Aldedh-domain-containing protein [Calocera cornea HHB12733]